MEVQMPSADAFQAAYEAALALADTDPDSQADREFQTRLEAFKAALDRYGIEVHRRLNVEYKRASLNRRRA